MNRCRALLLMALVMLAAGDAAGRDALFGVVSRGTTAVAVGDSGRILYSPQAPHVTWLAADGDATRRPLNAVTIGSNDYLAVGNGGRVLRSFTTVGDAWRPLSEQTDAHLLGASRGPNRFVAVGEGGVILVSAAAFGDGWSTVESPTQRSLRAVVGGSAFAVAAGDSGTILWSVSTSLTQWFAVAPDPTAEDLLAVAEGPGSPLPRFWAVGRNGTILRSTSNAQQWTQLDSPVSVDLNGIVFFGATGVAVGEGGTILFSNGGETWTPVESPTPQDFYAVAYTGSGLGGRFVAVGEENAIVYSTLGNVWDQGVVASRKTTWGGVRGAWGPSRPGK